ncbi:MAG TPA: hypothetical protein VFH31_18170 [Pyrinomonadaceae bacterium]|nr:hypothetical protein [Pyrinomonadaceae bacterium]
MSANASDQTPAEQPAASVTQVPKRITNAQTVCNEKNAKGKPCWGHLKQLRTAGEPAEVHLRGDDVLFKCQTCGTLYMGPPLGHVRDPYKQSRFVEAELTALLQAAGGTLPAIKKNERGVYVLVESAPHSAAEAKPAAAKPAAAPPSTAAAKAPAAPKAAAPAVPKPAAHKAGAEPNRELFRRSTYAGVKDTGPVPGETFEQKVARLKAVSAAAKQRAEEGGGEIAPSAEAAPAPVTTTVAATPAETSQQAVPAEPVTAPPAPPTAPPASAPAGGHKPTGQADRTLMRRSTYAGVTDTGPVPGETFAQKVERLRAVAVAAKQRAEGG